MSFRGSRENVGYSQAEVARMLNVDPSTVCLWESGKTRPRAALLPKLAALYCCSIDDLMAVDDAVKD